MGARQVPLSKSAAQRSNAARAASHQASTPHTHRPHSPPSIIIAALPPVLHVEVREGAALEHRARRLDVRRDHVVLADARAQEGDELGACLFEVDGFRPLGIRVRRGRVPSAPLRVRSRGFLARGRLLLFRRPAVFAACSGGSGHPRLPPSQGPPPHLRRPPLSSPGAPIWPHAPVTRYLVAEAPGLGSPTKAPRPVNM